MCTFADLMSLLLCFFVLLLSFSELDRQKYKEVAGSLEKAFGVQRKVKAFEIPKGVTIIAKDFNQEIVQTRRLDEFIATQMKKAVTEEIDRRTRPYATGWADGQAPDRSSSAPAEKDRAIQIESGDGEVRVRLMGEATFDTGKADLKAEFKPILARVAAILAHSPGDIVVAGHTDNVPLLGGPFRSNLGLSMARSAAVADYLITVAGVKPERINTMGSGEYKPIAANDTEEGRRRNRRVEIILKPSPSPAPSLARR
jgi:chemotaxis protein MotB